MASRSGGKMFAKTHRRIYGPSWQFNDLQRMMIPLIFETDTSLAIWAPSGAGKTKLFEMGIIRELSLAEGRRKELRSVKMLYLAPTDASCVECYNDWKRFEEFGVSLMLLHDENSDYDWKMLDDVNVLITRPDIFEKMSRTYEKDTVFLFKLSLVFIDDVDCVGTATWGCTLEVIVNRLKWTSLKNGPIRFIAAATFLANMNDIASWLTTPAKVCRPCLFGSVKDTVKSEIYFYTTPEIPPSHGFDAFLTNRIPALIREKAQSKPVLIFCPNRDTVIGTAEKLQKYVASTTHPKCLAMLANIPMESVECKGMLRNGIAFYHDGMHPVDLRTLEYIFRSGSLPVLVSTSALASGVNLNPHLVIVKNSWYSEDMSIVTIRQMVGRAGRTLWRHGNSIIMTAAGSLEITPNMSSTLITAESHLYGSVREILNSDIALGYINVVEDAVNRIKSTFLFIRLVKNLPYYEAHNMFLPPTIDSILQDMVGTAIKKLTKMEYITVSDGITIMPTAYGRSSHQHRLDPEIYKQFREVQGNCSMAEMLQMISNCANMKAVHSQRYADRHVRQYFETYGTLIRFPIILQSGMNAETVACGLIQGLLAGFVIVDAVFQYNLVQQASAIAEIFLDTVVKCPKGFATLVTATKLVKSLKLKLWDNSTLVTLRLPFVEHKEALQLSAANKKCIKTILASTAEELDTIVGRPIGAQILSYLACLPHYHIAVKIKMLSWTEAQIRVAVSIRNRYKISTSKKRHTMDVVDLLVGNTTSNTIVAREVLPQSALMQGRIEMIYVENVYLGLAFTAELISRNWVGLDCAQTAICPRYRQRRRMLPSQKKQKTGEVNELEHQRCNLTELQLDDVNTLTPMVGETSAKNVYSFFTQELTCILNDIKAQANSSAQFPSSGPVEEASQVSQGSNPQAGTVQRTSRHWDPRAAAIAPSRAYHTPFTLRKRYYSGTEDLNSQPDGAVASTSSALNPPQRKLEETTTTGPFSTPKGKWHSRAHVKGTKRRLEDVANGNSTNVPVQESQPGNGSEVDQTVTNTESRPVVFAKRGNFHDHSSSPT